MDIIRDGKIQGGWGRLLLIAVFLFAGARLFTGMTLDKNRVLQAIEDEIVDDLRQDLYAAANAADAAGDPVRRMAALEQINDMRVDFDDVSMSVPLFKWSANEDVAVRFDYVLWANGTEVRRREGEYRLVTRGGASNVWDSGPTVYWANFLF